MTRKILLLCAAFVCAALFVASCGKCDKSAATAGQKFTLRVGFDADFPPYGFRNENGELVGFDLDLAKEVCKRRDWNIELKPIDWDAKDAELDSGTINCIWNGFTINGREDKYTWTCPYVDNTLVFMVKGDSAISTLADLAGKVVEVQADSSGYAAISGDEKKELKESFRTLKTVPNYNNAAMELETGSCDAVIVDVAVADDIIRRAKAGTFRKLDEALSVEQYGVGFKLGDVFTRDQVEMTLRDMVADGVFQIISEKWFDGKNVCAIK